jgi:DNA-binding PadR family transcriptional regulator
MIHSVPRDELTLFSYEILGLVGTTGAGPHDLRGMVRRGRMLDWAGETRYYVEPKRLAKLGYLEARKEPGKTRERTIYTLTDKGMDALREWARTPVHFTPIKSEVLVRLLIADLVGEETTRESIATLRQDIADLSARLTETETQTRTLPHRRKYLLLVAGFLRRLLDLHLELVDEVERDLAPKRPDDPATPVRHQGATETTHSESVWETRLDSCRDRRGRGVERGGRFDTCRQ